MLGLALLLSVAISTANSSIPFTYFDNRMMIKCTIDGKGPFAMIVDTGDPVVSVTPETASRLAENVHNAGTITGAGNYAIKSGATTLQRLSIGALSFHNVSAESNRSKRDP